MTIHQLESEISRCFSLLQLRGLALAQQPPTTTTTTAGDTSLVSGAVGLVAMQEKIRLLYEGVEALLRDKGMRGVVMMGSVRAVRVAHSSFL